MVDFEYTAVDINNEISEGSIRADSSSAVVNILKKQSLTPVLIQEKSEKSYFNKKSIRFGNSSHLSNKDITFFTTELATILNTGTTLPKALELIKAHSSSKSTVALCDDLIRYLNQGNSLSSSLNRVGSFDNFYLSIIKAGETSGTLPQALSDLESYRINLAETRSSIISALIYPLILLASAFISIAIMLTYVVPQFAEMFANSGFELPLLTRVLASMGHFLAHWWLLIVISIVFISAYISNTIKKESTKTRLHGALLSIPWIGGLITKINTTRFAKSLSTMLQNGLEINESLSIAKNTLSNIAMTKAIDIAQSEIRKGQKIADSLNNTNVFPGLAIELISVGEQSGKLSETLSHIARIYEKEVDTSIKRFVTILEPTIIIIVALFITLIILSIVMLIMASNEMVI